MKRSRFTEEQIIGVLREQEAGMMVVEVCREHGISTEQRNTATIGVAATQDSTSEWREVGPSAVDRGQS